MTSRSSSILAGAVIPWLAFLAATSVTSGVSDSDLSLGGMIVAAPLYLLVVGGPSALVVAAAGSRWRECW